MTKYTAEDFAQAEFARHEDGRIAARVDPGGTYPWATVYERVSDAELAADPGWRIVRDAESLTAREHPEKAWEKAHEVDVIPAGAGYITKWGDGSIGTEPDGDAWEWKARGDFFERRLLDPPSDPARPEGAEAIEVMLGNALDDAEATTGALSPTQLSILADRLADRGVTVIVGADT